MITCRSVGVGVSLSILIYCSSISPLIPNKAAHISPRTNGGTSIAASFLIIGAVNGYPYKSRYITIQFSFYHSDFTLKKLLLSIIFQTKSVYETDIQYLVLLLFLEVVCFHFA